MSVTSDILSIAMQRATEKNLPYSGELTPREAFDLLQLEPSSVLVDVRSKAELELVGKVPNATHVEWALYPGMLTNPSFVAQLQAQVDKNVTVVFMCRSGGRSHNAAVLAKQLGYNNAYSMIEGFEGVANSLKQRTTVNGWKHAGLPWTN